MKTSIQKLFIALVWVTLPALVQAQFQFTINNGAITITGYNTAAGLNVVIPATINGYPVTSIGDSAFSGTSLTSVAIPNSVTSIGTNAFYNCTSLTSVAIGSSVTYIGDEAFWQCHSLTSVTIPDSVTSIGIATFWDCTSLTSVTIPNSVTSIGIGAFYDCNNLTSETIPNSVTSIGNYAFAKCSSMMSITVDASNPAYSSMNGILFDKAQATLLQFPGDLGGSYTIPNSVTSIGDDAFAGCYGLTSVTIPNSVISIGEHAFDNCASLTSVNIPNSVTTIGIDAFYDCNSLTSVTIPNSVTSIGNGAFWGCASLTSVTIPNSVTSIADNEFVSCSSLTSVTIPNSVTTIGNDAFAQCYSLTSVTIPNSVTTIEGGAFSDTSLTNVTIPDSVTSIGELAFAYSSLTSVTIPDSVSSIGYVAFAQCGSLTSVTIPNSVTSIGELAFWDCTSLTSVTIPNSVTSIGYEAFAGCTSLTSAYFLGKAPPDDATAFIDQYSGPDPDTVYYLAGATGWGSTFGGRPTALWIEVPTIQTSPQTQTAEAGSAVCLSAQATNALPMFYLWCLNGTNLTSYSTNSDLELTNLQFSQSGAYTVVFSNVLGAVTSAPAMLNVIPAVERRPVPGIKVAGDAASLLNLDYADSLSPAPIWKTMATITLSNSSQFYFDLTTPLPPQTFYRARQTGTPSVSPSLKLAGMVPAITLTGSIGDSLRLDYINQFGPTDAWVTLDTITLTNTSQFYFDVSVIGQPPRLWRIVPVH